MDTVISGSPVRGRGGNRTCVTRGNHGFLRILDTECSPKKIHCRTNVVRQFYGFAGSLDTGLPEIYVSVGASIRL